MFLCACFVVSVCVNSFTPRYSIVVNVALVYCSSTPALILYAMFVCYIRPSSSVIIAYDSDKSALIIIIIIVVIIIRPVVTHRVA